MTGIFHLKHHPKIHAPHEVKVLAFALSLEELSTKPKYLDLSELKVQISII